MSEKGLKHTIKNLGKITKMVRKEYEKDKNLGKLKNESDGNVREHLLKMGEFKDEKKWRQDIFDKVFRKLYPNTDHKVEMIKYYLSEKLNDYRDRWTDKELVNFVMEALNLAKEHFKKHAKTMRNIELALHDTIDKRDEEIARLNKTLDTLRKTIKDRMSFEDEQEKYITRLKADKDHYKNQVKTICYDQEQELTRLEKELKTARADIRECHEGLEHADNQLKSQEHLHYQEHQVIAKKLEAYEDFVPVSGIIKFRKHFAELLEKVKE